MKKILLSILLICSAASTWATDRQDVIYLKDSSVIRGQVLEYRPNQSVKVETSDGNITVYSNNAVDRILKESQKSYLKEGYRWFIYGEHFFGFDYKNDNTYLYGGALTTVHGVQMNPHLFLGAGIGFRAGEDDDAKGNDYMAVSLFADFRYDVLNKKCTPYLEARAGINNAIKGESGFYGALSLGYRIKRFQVDMGAETATATKISHSDYYDQIPVSKQELNFLFKLGFEF